MKKHCTAFAECLSLKSFSHICIARYHFLPPTKRVKRERWNYANWWQFNKTSSYIWNVCYVSRVPYASSFNLPNFIKLCKQELNRMLNRFFAFTFIPSSFVDFAAKCVIGVKEKFKPQMAHKTAQKISFKLNDFDSQLLFFRVFCLTSALNSRKSVFN